MFVTDLAKVSDVATLTNKATGRSRRFCNLFLFFLLTSYGALSPWLFYWLLEFSPTKTTSYAEVMVSGMKPENVFFNVAASGLKLHGWYFEKPGAKKVVLIHHGQGANIQLYTIPTVETFINAGCSVFIYDYEGFGMSEGFPSHEALRRDSEAAFAYLVQTRNFKPKQIVHCGLSIGTGVACGLAAERECAGIILLSPYTSLSKIAKRHLPHLRMYPDFMFPQPDFGADMLVANPSVPVLAIHGELDPLLPVSGAEELMVVAKGYKRLVRVPGGNHIGGLGGDVNNPASGGGIAKQFLDRLP